MTCTNVVWFDLETISAYRSFSHDNLPIHPWAWPTDVVVVVRLLEHNRVRWAVLKDAGILLLLLRRRRVLCHADVSPDHAGYIRRRVYLSSYPVP